MNLAGSIDDHDADTRGGDRPGEHRSPTASCVLESPRCRQTSADEVSDEDSVVATRHRQRRRVRRRDAVGSRTRRHRDAAQPDEAPPPNSSASSTSPTPTCCWSATPAAHLDDETITSAIVDLVELSSAAAASDRRPRSRRGRPARRRRGVLPRHQWRVGRRQGRRAHASQPRLGARGDERALRTAGHGGRRHPRCAPVHAHLRTERRAAGARFGRAPASCCSNASMPTRACGSCVTTGSPCSPVLRRCGSGGRMRTCRTTCSPASEVRRVWRRSATDRRCSERPSNVSVSRSHRVTG